MALVAYGNSDSSDFDDDENETVVIVPTTKTEVPKPTTSQAAVTPAEGQTLFNLLPRPSTRIPEVIEEDDEFLHKKATVKDVKPKTRITVPSLSDFKDVEDRPIAKPKITNGIKSGLLSMLPEPKHAGFKSSTSLIPNVLTKKPLVPTSVKKKEPLPSPIKKAKTETKSSIGSYSDESDNEEQTTDFFSINKPVELPPDNVLLDIDIQAQSKTTNSSVTEKKPRDLQSYFKQEVPQHVELEPDYSTPSPMEYGTESSSSYNDYQGPESSSGDLPLDEEAIRQLCGTRGKRRKEDIEIVDVNQQEVLADAREWLVKGLMDDTSKRVSSSKKRGDEPTSQQKRKHQITYLAHQAKAKEAELQNQWANSRMSRRQTQSKYGF